MANGIDPDAYKEYEASEKRMFEAKQRLLQINRKINMETDHAMKQQRRMQMVMTRSLGGGGVLGTAMSLMQNMASLKQQNYQTLKSLKEKEKTETLTKTEEKQKNMLAGNTTSNNVFEKLDKTFEKAFGGDSKWNKAFGGQGKMAAAGMGLGAVGGGLALGKAIIDSSPLMQQMLKLMNFGFMLILRPIGDFFGMLMRPIMILMLRKFIIPFYQKVYPWFIKEGVKLGTDITKLLDHMTSPQFWVSLGLAVTAGLAGTAWVAKAFTAKVFFDPMAQAFAKAMGIVSPTTPVVDPPKVDPPKTDPPKTNQTKINSQQFQQNQTGKAGSTTTGTNTSGSTKNISSGTPNAKNETKVDKVMKRLGATFDKSPLKALKQLPNLIGSFGKTAVGNSLQNLKLGGAGGGLMRGLGGILTGGGGQMLPAVLAPYLDNIPFMKEFKSQFVQGMWDATGGKGIDGTWLDDMITGGNTSNSTGMARGGMINERIEGIGKSGKRYTLGEAGSEMVIPLSKMGSIGGGGGDSGVTVNVTVNGSIYSDRDMLKFQRTIMKAIETSSTRKAKL